MRRTGRRLVHMQGMKRREGETGEREKGDRDGEKERQEREGERGRLKTIHTSARPAVDVL